MPYLENCPDLIAQWHPTKNGNLTALEAVGSDNYWWLCKNTCENNCLHEWKTNAQNRKSKQSGCPYCAKPARKCCPCNSLFFKSPELADQWHPTMNGELTPSNFAIRSNKEVWWLCAKKCPAGCLHEWKSSISNRSSRGCPFCSKKKICEHTSLKYTHPNLAEQWHPIKNGNLKSSEISSGSNKDIWWICPITFSCGCVHEWQSSPSSRSHNTGLCLYCCKQKWCEHSSLKCTNPELCLEWDYIKNKDVKTIEVLTYSKRKVWWKCLIGHPSYLASVSHRGGGTGCPLCKHKTEANLVLFFKNRNYHTTTQFTIDTCRGKTNKLLQFDMLLEEFKIIIELDGPQHFKEVSNWGQPDIKKDIYKMRKADANGYKVIRISQEDVYKYDEGWLEKYLLPEILSENRNHAYIATKSGLYDQHIEMYISNELITLSDSDSESEKSNEDLIIQL